MTEEQTAGQRMIASAKQALAFVQGEDDGCVVHIPDQIDTVHIRKTVHVFPVQWKGPITCGPGSGSTT